MNPPVRPWRLVVEPSPVDGALNMATDTSIQQLCAAGLAPPTIRIYTWARPTVSIGKFQDLGSVDVALCRALGIDLVRRPTGGSGVLHDDEVTYSVVASTLDGVPTGVLASYRWLCRGVEAAFRLLGLDARITRHARDGSRTSACYLRTAQADISLGTQKLSGAAQVWMGETVLQHGSFVISRDAEREARVFRLGAEGSAALAQRTATLSDRVGGIPEREEVVRAIRLGFPDGLGITVCEGSLSASESMRARSMASFAAL